MNAKLTALTALLTLAPAAAFARGAPSYAPPAPAYHPAAPVYVPTTVTPVRQSYRSDWERERCQAFERQQAEERAWFAARWGNYRHKMARFDAKQARDRADFYRELARNDRGHDRDDRHDRDRDRDDRHGRHG